jgi:hypothetical protein
MGIQVHTSTISGAGRDISNAALNGTTSKTSSAEISDSGNGDTVSLSGVSNLIALAKIDGSPDRQAKVDNLASLFRSGQYQANLSDVSRAMVQDLIVG